MQTVILECNILLSCDEETLTHTGQESITALVLEGGTEVPYTERLCEQKDQFFYENYLEDAVQADIEAAITAAGFTFESVAIEPGAIPANDPTPALDKVTITTCDEGFTLEGFKFCGTNCVFVGGEENKEEGGKESGAQDAEGFRAALDAATTTITRTTYKKREDYVKEAEELGLETEGLTVKELMNAIDTQKQSQEEE